MTRGHGKGARGATSRDAVSFAACVSPDSRDRERRGGGCYAQLSEHPPNPSKGGSVHMLQGMRLRPGGSLEGEREERTRQDRERESMTSQPGRASFMCVHKRGLARGPSTTISIQWCESARANTPLICQLMDIM